MKVYIICDSLKTADNTNISMFNNVVVEQLDCFGIDHSIISLMNLGRCKSELKKKSIVIIYNENKIQGENQNAVRKFLEKAVEVQAEIWPVAINRDKRMPVGIISKRQSYDVWEQLRCRNLDEAYLPIVAKIFSRKIVSRIFPTFYSEYGAVFLSHRRFDGEGITAKIYDKMKIQADSVNVFRDVVKVKVGEEAQVAIDKAMENSDVFIFIHTPKVYQSDWILKELRFALVRNIPVLWVQIDEADISKLKIKPSDNPHLMFKTKDFDEDKSIIKIVDKILYKAFELIMASSNKVFDYLDAINKLFGDKAIVRDKDSMLYKLSMGRKGYHYPQRDIQQYYQIYGRTPTEDDANKLYLEFGKEDVDSIAILTNRVINLSIRQNVAFDSIEDFYYQWNDYINEMKRGVEKMEIVVSGAFPECDEIYKQSLTDALVLFAKATMKNGYQLTFGSHPTFQELFFEVAKEVASQDARTMLNMYISEWFLENELEKEQYYNENCQLFKIEKRDDLNDSLALMRKNMIQRESVKALICLGGKIKEEKKEEGIREEIKLALKANIPVFIVGSVGGCSAKVALEYRSAGWNKLNNAPIAVNEDFLSSIDYFKMAQDMIAFLKTTENF